MRLIALAAQRLELAWYASPTRRAVRAFKRMRLRRKLANLAYARAYMAHMRDEVIPATEHHLRTREKALLARLNNLLTDSSHVATGTSYASVNSFRTSPQ